MKAEQPTSWLHPLACACDRCEPPAPGADDRLTFSHLCMLGFAGFMGGAGLAALYDPHATVVALAAIVGVGL